MVKKSLVWLYSATTYLLWAVVIVVAGVVLSLRYYVLPHVNDHREEIARHISAAAGQRLTIGEISAGWEGMHPYLDLYRVSLFDAQNRPVLQLGHVETRLSWLSLPLAELRLSRLIVNQPQVNVRRASDGTIYVAGISMSGPSRPAFPNWLLRQSRVDILDASVTWQDDMSLAPPLVLRNLAFTLENSPWQSWLGHHEFGLRATAATAASAPIDLRGNLWGNDVTDLAEWRGTIYGKFEGTELAVWRTWFEYPFDLSQGSGATQFWVDFSDGQVQKITADVLLANVTTRFASNMPESSFQNLSGRLSWQRQKDGEVLQAQRLRLTTAEGFSLQKGQLSVLSRRTEGKEAIEGEASLETLDLDTFSTFAANLPLGTQIHDLLQGYAPRGKLQQTSFSWQGTRDNVATYRLKTGFAGLGVSPYRGVPGFTGLSGELEASDHDGMLRIDSVNAVLDLKDILRWPIPADRLAGRVQWQNADGITQVQVNQLAITNAHLSGVLDASYRFDGQKGGYLDLKGRFGNADGRFAKFYYPLVLDQSTLDWLDTSIFNGHGEKIEVVIKGFLEDFPYPDNKKGEFRVSARIDDALLDYANAWPKVEGVGLDLLFTGNRMDLSVNRGRIYGAQIGKAKVTIPVLDAAHPVLQIQGDLQATAQDALKFIDNSPVAEAINHFTTGLQGSGSGKVALDIQVPLDNVDATRVKGSYTVNNAMLSGGDLPALQQINGRLSFTESWVRVQNATAQIYGNPASFNLETGANQYMHVTARGRVDGEGLRRSVDLPVLRRAQGATDWDAEITHRDAKTVITVNSSLEGLSASLPPPFNKSAAERWPLRYVSQVRDERQTEVSLHLGDQVSARFLKVSEKGASAIERGEVRFGGDAVLPASAGIQVKGKLQQLDGDWWREVLDDGGQKSAGLPDIAGINLEIGNLDLFGRRLNDLNLKAGPVADGWMGTLQSREINGDIRWQNAGKGKVLARLKSLQIPSAAASKMSAPDVPETHQDYPALDIVAEDFEAKGKKLGRLELLASQQGGDWNIQRLRITNPDSTLSVDGDWHNWKSKPDTRVNLDWEIDDVGKTLERFGYPGTIKGGEARMTGTLRWNGSPHEFNLPGLGGALQLDAKRGQFLKIQPGVGRLLGVLSLQSLPRRLMFDFRDLFNEGFAFDLISGTTQIERGVMKSKDFRMEGPAAKVEISGETNLDRETLNLRVKVNPMLSDTLSVAALAGGPVVGAAAFVAQKLLKDPFNKIASYQYDIAGTWDDPQEVKASAEKKETPTPINPLGK